MFPLLLTSVFSLIVSAFFSPAELYVWTLFFFVMAKNVCFNEIPFLPILLITIILKKKKIVFVDLKLMHIMLSILSRITCNDEYTG